MKGLRTSRRSLLGLLGAAPATAGGLLALAGTAQAHDSRPGRGRGHERIPESLRPGGEYDRLMAQAAAEDRFSGTIVLQYKGHRVLQRSYGMANKEKSIPNGPNTIFCLASLTKLFTSIAIAQLAQQRKLEYYHTLGMYLDGFRSDIAANVTIQHLLTHTSGLGNFQSDDYMQVSRTWGSEREVMDGTMSFVRNLEPVPGATPGARYIYSNAGYVTLGAIVERITGQSYYDYVRQNIFKAAGMVSSDFYTLPDWRSDWRIAQPYARMNPSEPRVPRIDEHMFIGTPAGDAFSNATDLLRFTDALLDNELLEPAYTWLTTTPKVASAPQRPGAGGPRNFHCFGPMATIAGDQWVVGHGGDATGGASVNLDWFPGLDWVTVVLSNYEGGSRLYPTNEARRLIVDAASDNR